MGRNVSVARELLNMQVMQIATERIKGSAEIGGMLPKDDDFLFRNTLSARKERIAIYVLPRDNMKFVFFSHY